MAFFRITYPYMFNVVEEPSGEIPRLALVFRPSRVSTEHGAGREKINMSV
jgi:hypothetical protein